MTISKIALTVGILSVFSFSALAQDSERLSSVKLFADTVLDKAGDRYGHNSPLLADGVDPRLVGAQESIHGGAVSTLSGRDKRCLVGHRR